MKRMYENSRAYIKMDERGREFQISRGARQGDPLFPSLFNCVLEDIFRKLNWEQKGIKINGEFMNNLRYADGIVLIAQNTKELKEMAVELLEKCWEAGLSLNAGKTKIIGTGKKQDIQIWGETTEEVEEVIYL